MGVSRFSFLSALLWCCGFTLVGSLIRRRRLLKKAGPRALLSLHLLGAVRLVFPVEFPITNVIPLVTVLNPLVGDDPVPLKTLPVLLTVWICGSAIALIRFSLRYVKLHRKLSSYRMSATGTHLLNQAAGKPVRVRVVLSPIPTVPYVFGLRKPTIILPQCAYSIAELRDVMLHEYTHIRYGHLWIKFALAMLCCIYWWFPVVYLLRHETNSLLELLCDDHVLKDKSPIQALDYGELLLRSSTPFSSTNEPVQTKFANRGTTILRLEHILDFAYGRCQVKKHLETGMALLALLILLFSYSFLLQSRFDPLESNYTAYAFGQEESYLVPTPSGTYILVMKEQTTELTPEQAEKLIADGFRVIDKGG